MDYKKLHNIVEKHKTSKKSIANPELGLRNLIQKSKKNRANSLNDNFFELLGDKNKRINLISKKPNSRNQEISILNRLGPPAQAKDQNFEDSIKAIKCETCNICNEKVENNEAYVILKCCGTMCHYNCILNWTKSGCVSCLGCGSRLKSALIESWYEISNIILFIKNYARNGTLCCFKPLDDKDIIRLFDNDDDCTICLEKFRDKSEYVILECGHRYHYNCLASWVTSGKHSCPTCRAELSKAQIAPYTIKPLYETKDIVALCRFINKIN